MPVSSRWIGLVLGACLAAQAVPAWVARHGLSAAQYQHVFDSLKTKGYRLVDVSGYAVGNEARYAALWDQSGGPAWQARHGLTSAQYQHEFDSLKTKGYRPVWVSGYEVAGQDYYAAIWNHAGGAAWDARHGLTAAQYQHVFDSLKTKGYRLLEVSGYACGHAVCYAAIWDKSAGPVYEARHGLTASEYQHVFDSLTHKGFRLREVSGYGLGNQDFYAAIWDRQSGLPWQAKHGLSASDYQLDFDDFFYQGYRPVEVDGYTVSGSDRYAAIWDNPAYSQKDLDKIDSVVNQVLRTTSAPAISMAVARNGRLVFAKAYGMADKENHEPAHADSHFRIMSVTKTITSAAIFKLKEMGKLKLDDKVFGSGAILDNTYGTPANYTQNMKKITVRNLLNHDAGGWSGRGKRSTADTIDPMFTNPSMDHAQLITWTMNNLPLVNPPGKVYCYANFGFCLLGRVVEKLGGQSYAAWVKAHVLAPCGIHDMEIAGSTLADRNTALHEVKYYAPGNPYGYNIPRMDSHGGWIASAVDLARFGVHDDGVGSPADLLTKADWDTTMTPPKGVVDTAGNPSNYGCGWVNDGGGSVWHNGGLDGTSAMLHRTGDGFIMISVSNSRDTTNPNTDFSFVLDQMMTNVKNAGIAWPGIDLF